MGGGGALAGTPLPLWSSPKAGHTFLGLNPLGIKGAQAKFWLSASNIGKGRGGGGTPPSSCGVRPF